MRRRFRLLGPRPSSLLVQSLDDIEVFADFYRAYYESILAFLARRVLDPEVAFDLMSETFAKALERRRQFRGQTTQEEQAWLFAIARTELLHYWRSGKTERAAIQRFSISVPALSDEEADRVEALAGLDTLAESVAGALDALPADQRAAVELRVVREHSYAEVAAALAISEQTARARVSRGLRALARELSDEPLQDMVGDTA
ncbi:RNA polymerase sigma factor [Solirubrobacter soli]|uniref:RNA polymerase sigma factor n=1 Tax=Solirubrobacter soli TaxID=363832 RepID=UPI0003F9B551|nr:RNA polymerase sigma factor [Solirubrobacter soli]